MVDAPLPRRLLALVDGTVLVGFSTLDIRVEYAGITIHKLSC